MSANGTVRPCSCPDRDPIVEPEMTEQIRRLSLPRIWTDLRLTDVRIGRIRVSYEKAREYFRSLLDRETEASSARIFQLIGGRGPRHTD